MHLFIDTNILLSFYHFKSDDLEELRKLSLLLRRGEVVLLLTDQVAAEFRRNRENKIADAIKRLKEQKLDCQFPQLCKDYDEYHRLREYRKQYEKEHNALLEKINEDVRCSKLKADRIFAELDELGTEGITTDEIIKRARLRMEIGNPPGKNGSLGDAINWEILLAIVPNQQDLFFITEDKDYCSPLDVDTFNEFLLDEWHREKQSEIFYYKQLSSLFKEKFPDIKLASESEKDSLIQELSSSDCFKTTHKVIAKLRRCSDFTSIQLNEIVDAAVSNSQVCWIISDEGIKQFLSSMVSGKEHCIDEGNLRKLKEALKVENSDNLDDRPF